MDSEIERVRLLYLDLLKKCLTRSFLDERYERIPKNVKTLWRFIRYSLYSLINRLLSPWNLVLVHSLRPTGETMIGMERLNNLHDCIMDVLKRGVPGDLVETGVWRGGGHHFHEGDAPCVWRSERRRLGCGLIAGLAEARAGFVCRGLGRWILGAVIGSVSKRGEK